MSLPKLSRTEESIHIEKIKLETPKINVIEINEKPREMRLEVAILTKNILGDSVPKLHAKWRMVLGPKLGRRVNPTRLVKRKVHSMCRSPSKPPDRQNSLDENAKEKNIDNRPPKPHYILNAKKEVIGIIEKEYLLELNNRPPPKPPQKAYDIVRV